MNELADNVEMLSSLNWVQREKAAVTLGKIGDPGAVEPLVTALKDENAWIRANAAEALGLIGAAEPAVEPLLRTARDNDEWVRVNAVQALARLGHADTLETIRGSIQDDESPWMRLSFIRVAGEINQPWVVEPLGGLLYDQKQEVSDESAQALGKIPDIKVLEFLRPYYESSLDKKEAGKKVRRLIEKLAPLQKENMDSWPDLLCMNCYKRPKTAKIKLGLFKSLKYAVCRDCGTSMLAKGIKEVVGVINDRIGHYLEGETLYIQLWDSESEECVYADIDRLEIWEVPDLPYDIAVNVLVLKLYDYRGTPHGYLKKIPVRLVGDPAIPVGSISVLEQEFLEVRR